MIGKNYHATSCGGCLCFCDCRSLLRCEFSSDGASARGADDADDGAYRNGYNADHADANCARCAEDEESNGILETE